MGMFLNQPYRVRGERSVLSGGQPLVHPDLQHQQNISTINKAITRLAIGFIVVFSASLLYLAR